MSTEKLYYQDAYRKEFTANVLSCEAAKNGFAVVLDRTAFYPEGGGQPCDLGTLGAARVLDVQERGEEIVHTCDAPLSGEVCGRIDWARRFDLMQQHSGEHLLSGLVYRRYGFDNVGFHMGADVITVDFSGVIPTEDLPALEYEVNEGIWQNAQVLTLFPTEEERAGMFYRSKKALTGQVRIVRVPGMDDCACCGTHVARTGEVGLFKLLSCVRFHQGVRLELVCGARAYRYLGLVHEQNREISGLLSAKPLETAAAVRRLQDEHDALKYTLVGWKNKYFTAVADRLCGDGNLPSVTASAPAEARRERQCSDEGGDKRSVCEAPAARALAGDGAIVPAGMNAPCEGGRDEPRSSVVLAFQSELSPADVSQLCLLLMEKTDKLCAVFSGSDETGWKYAIGQTNGNLRDLIKDFNAHCQGRGGGRPNFAQGSAQANKSRIEAFFAPRGSFIENH